jgi:hypothetical protein
MGTASWAEAELTVVLSRCMGEPDDARRASAREWERWLRRWLRRAPPRLANAGGRGVRPLDRVGQLGLLAPRGDPGQYTKFSTRVLNFDPEPELKFSTICILVAQ